MGVTETIQIKSTSVPSATRLAARHNNTNNKPYTSPAGGSTTRTFRAATRHGRLARASLVSCGEGSGGAGFYTDMSNREATDRRPGS